MRDAAEAVVEHTKLAGLRFVVCRQSVSSDRTSRLSGDGPATSIIHQRRSGIREDAQGSNACQINWLTQRHEAVLTLQSCEDRPRGGCERGTPRKCDHGVASPITESVLAAREQVTSNDIAGLFKQRIPDRGTATVTRSALRNRR